MDAIILNLSERNKSCCVVKSTKMLWISRPVKITFFPENVKKMPKNKLKRPKNALFCPKNAYFERFFTKNKLIRPNLKHGPCFASTDRPCTYYSACCTYYSAICGLFYRPFYYSLPNFNIFLVGSDPISLKYSHLWACYSSFFDPKKLKIKKG